MGKLLGTAVFGSVARGDNDTLSDLDVLALVENGAGMVPPAEVTATLPLGIGAGDAAISWYGVERYREMHASGELFAWHIFLDARVAHDPGGLFAALGAPAPYVRAEQDSDAFIAIAEDLPEQLAGAACNAVYEMGVLYVCLRNVAMSASWCLGARADFTRLAPYRLARDTVALTLPEDEYRVSMLCRLAGQRGLTLPSGITPDRVMRYHRSALAWMHQVRGLLDTVSAHG
jgi:hypothetical protein